MANRFLGEASTVADGKTWTLRLDFNAMAAFEEKTGKNAMSVLEGFEKGQLAFSDIRQLAWAMLLRHHPDATLDDAGDVLSVDVDVIQRVLAASMPEPDAGNGKAAKGKAA
jgi:hypothetical protein